MYKNIICFFSFFLLPKRSMSWSSKRVEGSTHRGWGTNLLWTALFFVLLFRLKFPKLYNIPDTHANSHGHIISNLLLTCCIWTCLLLACHPSNLHDISTRDTCVNVYFRYQVHFQLFFFRMSDFCSCINMSREVFKSISNNRTYLYVIQLNLWRHYQKLYYVLYI